MTCICGPTGTRTPDLLAASQAHGLRSRLSPDMLAVFETAVRYQMYDVFALLITRGRSFPARRRAAALRRGVVLYYRVAVVLFRKSSSCPGPDRISSLGAITPILAASPFCWMGLSGPLRRRALTFLDK